MPDGDYADLVVGRTYTHKDTCRFGGNQQVYLPYTKDGGVVAGRFTTKLNPFAPWEVYADGDTAVIDAARLAKQDNHRIPVFLKQGTDAWLYVGILELTDIRTDWEDLEEAKSLSGRETVDLILVFDRVEGQPSMEPPPDVARRVEGERRVAEHFVYERQAANRRACIAAHGVRCSVCGFDFGAVYGEIGEGFIEVHHLTPLSELAEAREVDPVGEMRPVCSNCHQMIHRRRSEVLSVEDLRARLRARVSTLAGSDA